MNVFHWFFRPHHDPVARQLLDRIENEVRNLRIYPLANRPYHSDFSQYASDCNHNVPLGFRHNAGSQDSYGGLERGDNDQVAGIIEKLNSLLDRINGNRMKNIPVNPQRDEYARQIVRILVPVADKDIRLGIYADFHRLVTKNTM